jgi:hypothetical protein
MGLQCHNVLENATDSSIDSVEHNSHDQGFSKNGKIIIIAKISIG